MRRIETLSLLLLSMVVGSYYTRVACGQQLLKLDSDSEPTKLAYPYLDQRVTQLKEEIAQMQERLRAEQDEYKWLATVGGIKARQIALELLASGQSQPSAAIAVLYGTTVANSRQQLDSLFAAVPAGAQRIAGGFGRGGMGAQQKLETMVAAMQRFVGLDHKSGVDFSDLGSVEAYVYRLFCPLVVLLEPSGLELPRTTWLRGEAFVTGDASEQVGTLRIEAVDRLIHRVEALDSQPQVSERLIEILTMTKKAVRFEDLLPRAEQVYWTMQSVVGLAEKISEPASIEPADQDRLNEVLSATLALYRDPNTRSEAVKRLEVLVALEPMLDAIQLLRADGVWDQGLGKAFTAAVERCREHGQEEESWAVLDWLGTIVGTLGEVHRLDEKQLPVEIRRVFLVFNREFQQVEEMVGRQAVQLASAPAGFYQPHVGAMRLLLRQRADELVSLVQLQQWLEAVNRYSYQPAFGINRRFNESLAKATKSWEERKLAAGELAEFGQQVNQFALLPGEERLRRHAKESDPDLAWIPREMVEGLLGVVDRQRGEWLSAWASAQEADEAGKTMVEVERLMRWLSYVEGWRDLDRNAEILNLWAGWEVEPKVTAGRVQFLQGRLLNAITAAIHGQSESLNRELDAVESNDSVGLLITELYSRMGPRLGDAPKGAAGVLSQLLYPPDEKAYLGGLWNDLASMSWLLNETMQLGSIEPRPFQDQLAESCARVMKQLQMDR